MTLVKAQLVPVTGSGTITFMFNPEKLSFRRSMGLKSEKGARNAAGIPKVNFAGPEPCTLTISSIHYDTFESGQDVYNVYIKPLIATVKFISGQDSPPVYNFVWGGTYMKCFVKSLDYNLTMFLPSGMPVRADVSMTLEEVDDSEYVAPQATPQAIR